MNKKVGVGNHFEAKLKHLGACPSLGKVATNYEHLTERRESPQVRRGNLMGWREVFFLSGTLRSQVGYNQSAVWCYTAALRQYQLQ